MKKFAYIAIALVMGVFTSCTNKDEIEITKHQSLTVNINTQGIFDDFNITDAVRENFLRDESQCVGVLTLIYNSKGSLVTKGENYLKNFNTAVQVFDKLAEDDYTIVIIETLVNPDDNYQSEVWSFDDLDKLSTLKITQRKEEPDSNGYRWTKAAYACNAIGLYTGNISVKSSSTIEIRPKPIGSVIKFNSYNFENSIYETVGYTTQDILEYYSPDPSLNRENRYTKNLTASGKTNVRILIKADANPSQYWGTYILEPEMEWQPITQTLDQYNQGTVSPWDPLHVNLEDGKTYYIGFYYLWNEGDISYASYAFFEKESELLEWKLAKDDDVSRHDGGSLFTEPYTTWDVGTVSAVKTYMNGFYLHKDIEYNSNLGMYGMIYYDRTNNDVQYQYYFTSSTRGLTDAILYLKEDYFSIEDVLEEINKHRYTFKGNESGMYLFENTSLGTGVSVQSYYGSIIVDYYSLEAYSAPLIHQIPANIPSANGCETNGLPTEDIYVKMGCDLIPIESNTKMSHMKKIPVFEKRK